MIYFDNAATTRCINNSQEFYNPSSPHSLGIKAERALRAARNTVATVLGCASSEIIFTSGGTESNNLAILGCALANARQGLYMISAPYEHPSLLAPIQFASERGWGKSQISQAIDCIPPGNVLASISHVSHETGDINNINTISESIKKLNPSAIIHIDGAQGFCKEDVCLRNVDLYSFSGHKCHGPVGTGGLWVRKGVRLTSLMHGGGQENGLRSGTESVSSIVQLADAVDTMHKGLSANRIHVANIKSVILGLKDVLPDVFVNSLGVDISPYILNMSFLGVKGEVLVHALSEKGLYVSMGAACRSRKRSQSALSLMGFTHEIAESAIRFSFSPYNTLAEAELALNIIFDEVSRLRKVLGVR